MVYALHTVLDGQVDFDGVNISPAMLEKAAEHLNTLGIAARLQEADLLVLPFEDGRFDVIMVAHVLEHLADPEQALTEFHRVLKPGGIVILCVTRRSTLGRYIQLKWRTHGVAIISGLDWLRKTGFRSVRAVPFPKRSMARRLSIGYVGRKP